MALNAKNKEYEGGGKRVEQPPMEAGTYPARLVQVIDLGVQEQQPFKGEPKPPAQELMVTYEFPGEYIVDENGDEQEDKPRWLSETFPLHNLESDRARSTARYYAIDPDCKHDGDWSALIGQPVMVQIVQNAGKGKNAGRIFNNISGTAVMRAKEAAKLDELKNPGKVLDLDDVSTVDIFLTLPEFIQTKIKSGLEFEGSAFAKAVKSAGLKKDMDDEVPFDGGEPAKGKVKAKAKQEQAGPDEGDGDW